MITLVLLLLCGAAALGGAPANAGEGAGATLRTVAKPAEIPRTPAPPAKLRVVNIWATWCVPCVHEMDDLRAVSDAFKSKGVDFIGVSMDDVIPGDSKTTRNKVEKFLTDKTIRYPNYYYTGAQNALVDAFAFGGELPVTLVYDREGKELFRVEGAIDKKKLSERLNQLLKK
jgi:thiol-disulfide isomerase/thioredoxin